MVSILDLLAPLCITEITLEHSKLVCVSIEFRFECRVTLMGIVTYCHLSEDELTDAITLFFLYASFFDEIFFSFLFWRAFIVRIEDFIQLFEKKCLIVNFQTISKARLKEEKYKSSSILKRSHLMTCPIVIVAVFRSRISTTK